MCSTARALLVTFSCRSMVLEFPMIFLLASIAYPQCHAAAWGNVGLADITCLAAQSSRI